MSAAAELLERTARRRELHHAIILHGPARDELRGLATRLARITLCPARSGDDACPSCGKVDRGSHPDFHLVEVREDRKMISIDQVRETVAEATLRPYQGEAKVFIIDPADALTRDAENSMLKTLEEPPADTFFFLLSRSPDLLLPTIRSRSQSLYIGPSDAKGLALASFGALAPESERWSRFIIDRIGGFAAHGETAALLEAAATLGALEPAGDVIALLVSTLRDLAAGRAGDGATIEEIRSRIPAAALLDAASLALDSSRRLAVNVDTRLMFEQILLTLAV